MGGHAVQHPINNVPTGTCPTPSSSELQQVLKGIKDLKASLEQNLSSIRGQLDNHEERLRSIERASAVGPGKKQIQQRNCYTCGKVGHIARNCRVGSVQGYRHDQGGDNNSYYQCQWEGLQGSRILAIPGMSSNMYSCFLSDQHVSVMDSICLVLLRLRSVLHSLYKTPCVCACDRFVIALALSAKATPRITLGVVGSI